MVPVTTQAHELVQRFLSVGDLAIDATAGNGHDTLFLAQQVGPTGKILAFDIQQEACDRCRERVENLQFDHVKILCADHQNLKEHLDPQDHGKVSAVMFNLGYLPGSPRDIITHSVSTIRALDAALSVLRPGGVLSVVIYRGHPGGLEEATAVQQWMHSAIMQGHRDPLESPQAPSERGPQLLALQKAISSPG
ncbi:MAG TPA: class I SAM-dependent methyltransferase [Planctomicrobium sp.]|nr:class I SAM-dependent methyltransferase [Planctomicrobium sp.]